MRWPRSTCAVLAIACGGGTVGPAPYQRPVPVVTREARCTQDFGDPGASPYVLPFPVGRTYEMFQGNCAPDPRWGHHNWLAYDFDLAIGDTVIASRAGRVIFVEERWPDSDRVCGHENGVWVLHEDGTVMSYGHFTTGGALVGAGEQVEAGDPLGLSGDSGCSSGPHLHVALFYDATNFDARNTIPLNYRNADGPLDERRGLVQGSRYAARPR